MSVYLTEDSYIPVSNMHYMFWHLGFSKKKEDVKERKEKYQRMEMREKEHSPVKKRKERKRKKQEYASVGKCVFCAPWKSYDGRGKLLRMLIRITLELKGYFCCN